MAREYQSGNRPQGGNKTGGERASSRNLAEVPFWSPEVSGTRPHKPPRRKYSLLGSSPLIPALFLLVLVVLLPSSKWFRQSVHAAIRFPVLQQISALIQGQKKQQPMPKAIVWINRRSGFYYCRGTMLFGIDRGKLMAQDKALMSGYRPADGQYCTVEKEAEVSRNSDPSRRAPDTK